mmetsp:Transcript_50271/g.75066  ORF Transcript_50271/g.75066 Transcript_50271/m.75066 type:complete len:333 (-) Transcript_50271:99-1097(-)|eukprot:CAMPEP_0194051476 /NCGR_PEP_ID=MMETSP0009_2-20130614/40689_1 /TAXON_ID=210454 /ORGANISM="Grammatophora oceanica, Strain CCMP 410" /LENGTH=332 /DNA_ID=CAMNT_0038698571 /DNA_START=69 /DNA_END=1067 /DNA_ORIENTATION=+
MKSTLCALFLLLGTTRSLSLEVSRRQALQGLAGAAGSGFLLTGGADKAEAANPDGLTVPKGKPVLVLGAGGKTGRECVASVLASGRPCIATTRSGELELEDEAMSKNRLLTIESADVSSVDSLKAALTTRSLGAVIFAASSSTKADPFPVDRDGVIETAKLCIGAGIPRFVIVSSGTVTRPDSAVYKLLNFAGKGIMEAKIQGEDAVREMYSSSSVLDKKLGYTVIRPGGLTTEASIGAAGLELNQGDSKSGRLPRADVAALCVNCLDSPDAFDTTFECYESNTAKPIESVGLSNIMKSTDATTFVSGFERRGENFGELFTGLARDPGHEIA